MGYASVSLFLVAFVLFQVSVSQAQLLPGLPVLTPLIPGLPGLTPLLPNLPQILTCTLFCSPTGNSPGAPLAGANITVVCNIGGVPTVVGQNTTNVNGLFTIIPSVLGLVTSLMSTTIPCIIFVPLSSINSTVCPLLANTTGVLVSAINTLLGTILSPVFGLLQRVGAVGFIRLTITL